MALAADYDLILMDVNMPIMDGLEALAEIRRLALAAPPPVVALTADALEENHRRFRTAGMAACVTKPIDEEELLRAIAAVLRRPEIMLAGPPAPTTAVASPDAPALTERQRDAVRALIATIGDDEDPS